MEAGRMTDTRAAAVSVAKAFYDYYERLAPGHGPSHRRRQASLVATMTAFLADPTARPTLLAALLTEDDLARALAASMSARHPRFGSTVAEDWTADAADILRRLTAERA
jgi:hypothetical protein